jgi:hypothetical protein
MFPSISNVSTMGLGLSATAAYMPNSRVQNLSADFSRNQMDGVLPYSPDIAVTTQPMEWSMGDTWSAALGTGGMVQNGFRNESQIFPSNIYGAIPNGMGG